MLRVVLCIICLHPFLGVFLFALLYHTVKDFSRVNFAENVRVLHFLDVLQISWRRWKGRKTLRRGAAFYSLSYWTMVVPVVRLVFSL